MNIPMAADCISCAEDLWTDGVAIIKAKKNPWETWGPFVADHTDDGSRPIKPLWEAICGAVKIAPPPCDIDRYQSRDHAECIGARIGRQHYDTGWVEWAIGAWGVTRWGSSRATKGTPCAVGYDNNAEPVFILAALDPSVKSLAREKWNPEKRKEENLHGKGT